MRRALLTALASVAAPAYAEEPTEVEGETIVVTGLRLPRPVTDTPATVIVVEREEIERSPQPLTDEILRTLPSLGTFRRSSSLVADPTSQGVNLRGVGPSAVSRGLVLRDGIPVNDPFGGWMYWRSVSPLGLDRVEVAPSGASALFGDFALGGVVHMISRPIERREAQALIAGGSYGTGRVAARVTERAGAFGVAVDGDAFHSNGYAPIAQRGAVDGAAASTHGTAGVRVEHVKNGSTTHLHARWFRQALDAGTQFTTADVRTLTYGIGWKLARRAQVLEVQLFAGDHLFLQDRARVSPDRSSATLASEQRTPSTNQGALVTYATDVGRHSFLVGVDGRRVTGTATDVLSPAMVEPDTLVERAAGGEQRFAGVFVEDAMQLSRRLTVAAALRLDGWQNRAGALDLVRGDGDRVHEALATTSAAQLNPRIGVLGHLSDELALRASVYRAFRAPTLNELYRPFQVGTVLTAANESLRAETLWGAEAGPQVVVSNVMVRATGFYNRLADAIGNITLAEPGADGAQRQRQNFGTARIAGLELEASWRPVAAWTVTVAHTFIHARVTDAPDAPMLVGKRLAHDPPHRSTAAIAYENARIASITAQVRYLGPSFEDDLNTLPIGSTVLVDARVARPVGEHLAVFVAGQNLFDRRYLVGRAGIDTLGAPRTVEVGVSLTTR